MAIAEVVLNSYIGLDSERIAGVDAVCEQMIRHWTEVMEDTNPLYSDPQYAKNTKYEGVIAPPMQVQVYTMNPLWPKPERDPNSMENLLKVMAEEGYSTIVATEQNQEYFTPMKPGDQISQIMSVKEISAEKQTARGPGYFVTFAYKFINQNDEVVCQQTFTILVYNSIAALKEEVK